MIFPRFIKPLEIALLQAGIPPNVQPRHYKAQAVEAQCIVQYSIYMSNNFLTKQHLTKVVADLADNCKTNIFRMPSLYFSNFATLATLQK